MKQKEKKKISRKKLTIWAIVLVLFLIFSVWQNETLTVTEYTYTSEKVTDEIDGFRIVQISDLHNKNCISRLSEKIAELNPDIIVITGDIVDGTRTNIKKAVEFVESAEKIAPTYYATGNHEYIIKSAKREKLLEGIDGTGAEILIDRTIDLGENFTLTGIDGLTLMSLGSLKRIIPTDENSLNIVLAHEPQLLEDYCTSGSADLVFTGHAHGGQFILPFIGSVFAPDQGFFPKYTDGVHEMNGTTMIISRGIGNSGIPLRIFNYPEIVCVDLKSE